MSVGVDDLDRLKQTLNRIYEQEYEDHDWPHLRRLFTAVSLPAGSYLYDFPSDLNFERVERAVVWYNSLPHECVRGIGFDEYSQYDSLSDERSDPVQRWDVRDVAGATQFEVWPIPSTAQTIQFQGIRSISRLVADADVCLLDDNLIILGAAAALHKDTKRREELRKDYAERSRVLRAHGARTAPKRQLGISTTQDHRPTTATVRVS